MAYIKERQSLPVPEEKQILDAFKIVLDNKWLLGEQEILQIFDMIGVDVGKIQKNEDNLSFLEFIYMVCKLFQVDMYS